MSAVDADWQASVEAEQSLQSWVSGAQDILAIVSTVDGRGLVIV
jgi:hypothetical protein